MFFSLLILNIRTILCYYSSSNSEEYYGRETHCRERTSVYICPHIFVYECDGRSLTSVDYNVVEIFLIIV